MDRVQEVQDADGEADLRRPDGAPGGSDWVGWAAGMEAAGRRPEWRGGRRPKGGAWVAQSATFMWRVGSPGGGGQWGWRCGARRSGSKTLAGHGDWAA